ncbi:hypothetical protein COCMIDRAFT_4003 [Bipolaris oryzae ATCC 44560]|uniref:Uncharacterized protein n=1 Tax=Bipolaris oryzae ATCC 44560 TaxID=930090 RepID=W6ZAK3_COCMI|nr:uncharacterized protein COCMIDRAFT_4003 [Bipolaris oryzae ATCC 44560]EUC47010.1 hypothetical protein COCMIDRAFT_4003 [Bipolaris oryzae ATCC 44560]
MEVQQIRALAFRLRSANLRGVTWACLAKPCANVSVIILNSMNDMKHGGGDPHPLLAQVPLTVSPFISLPTATPLPYSYKSLPSTLPPSVLSQQQQQQQQQNESSPSHHQQQEESTGAYVVSASGTSASPDQILSSCTALQAHLKQLEDDARRTLAQWEDRRRAEDLAEKRRVAPGWLDSGVHILKPEGIDEDKGKEPQQQNLMDLDPQAEQKAKQGEELDRVFGGLKV